MIKDDAEEELVTNCKPTPSQLYGSATIFASQSFTHFVGQYPFYFLKQFLFNLDLIEIREI